MMSKINNFYILKYGPLLVLFLMLIQTNLYYQVIMIYLIFWIITKCWDPHLKQIGPIALTLGYWLLSFVFGMMIYSIFEASQFLAACSVLCFYCLALRKPK